MRRWYPVFVCCVLSTLFVATSIAALPVSAAPGCAAGVVVRPVTLSVDGENATGRVYEPYRCAEGDVTAQALVVAVHGHEGSSADFADYLVSIARRTATPILSMDLRSVQSVWRPGEWNLWAGWRDIVAATAWYQDAHPALTRTVLWGWSQGGITSGLAVAHGPRGMFDYWVDNYGPADDFTMWLGAVAVDPALPGQIERDAGGCPPTACPLAYVDRSPALLAHRMDVRRAFLVHGTADDVVPYATSVEMRAGLLAAGKPTSMYTVVTGRDLTGRVVPGDHSVGPAFFEGGCVVERLLLGVEPVDGPDRDYVVDVAHGVVTAPSAPPGAKCAA
ncbi:prolyl oligopeptidase family serine peptidase [Nocardia sp. NBC_00508]|uniref:alpha/beta hydrolase family protein n=1 Tax=Nocardia sp. NBC_00508 TaxID=2975992 RepID=UPI002E80ACC7|nr:prolyl oligopeptidase family serine peptidase [Nocardia sp. NBC_00508]WUD67525.1 prolyl oligopeptidase family serine peptidase [Nocardia sp. NBC_00508]